MNGKRQHPPGFKAAIALEAMRTEADPAEIAKANGIHISLVYAWRQRLIDAMAAAFRSEDATTKEKESDSRRLTRQIERLRDEREWLCRVVSVMPRRQRAELVERDGGLSISTQARLLGLHRSMVYYQSEKRAGKMDDASPSDSA
ncbi:MAG: hypothetical protein LUC93_11835 [Planctomycetaceae bacterium]|nr:hypothetical protein [Planctomycetaceae bacterium]